MPFVDGREVMPLFTALLYSARSGSQFANHFANQPERFGHTGADSLDDSTPLTWGSVIEVYPMDVLCGLEGPEAFRDMLPRDSEVNKCELHLLAVTMNKDGSPRNNPITDSIVFDLLHNIAYQEPDPGSQLGYAAQIFGELSRSAATDITMDAIEQMVLDSGFQDPTVGLESVCIALETALNKD